MGEFFGRAEGAEAGGEILEGQGVEIKVGVVGEERAINGAVLQTGENFAGLFELLRGGGIVTGQEQGRDGVGDRAGGIGGVLIGEDDDGDALVGEDNVLCSEAGNFTAVGKRAVAGIVAHIHAEAVARAEAILQQDIR